MNVCLRPLQAPLGPPKTVAAVRWSDENECVPAPAAGAPWPSENSRGGQMER